MSRIRDNSKKWYLDNPTFCYSEFESDVKDYCKTNKITQDLFSRMCGNKSHSMLASARRYGSISKDVFSMACEIIGKDTRRYFTSLSPKSDTDQPAAPVSTQANDTATLDALAQIVSEMKEQTQALKDITEALRSLSSAWS